MCEAVNELGISFSQIWTILKKKLKLRTLEKKLKNEIATPLASGHHMARTSTSLIFPSGHMQDSRILKCQPTTSEKLKVVVEYFTKHFGQDEASSIARRRAHLWRPG